MKKIVISGINLYTGGPLSIYMDFLSSVIRKEYDKKYSIVAFVHKKELFSDYTGSGIRFIELPKSRESYLYRIFYEYMWFYSYSRKQDIYLWISLHDMTPNVVAVKRLAYCHSPLPFLRLTPEIVKNYPGVALMKYLYRYIYQFNIKKNDCVIVQQDWMRKEFYRHFGLKRENVAVCKPVIPEGKIINGSKEKSDAFIFVYAAYPRFFKNFDVIAKAVKILNLQNQNFKVIFTIDGKENKYSGRLYKKYHDIKNIIWRGLMPRKEVFELYGKADALIFPSLLETWGLPISEFKLTGKLMLLSDLPYAYEAVQPYDKAVFFDPNNEVELARIMGDAIAGKIIASKVDKYKYEEPYYKNWYDLLEKWL